jgi:hypothetical protein
MAGCLALESLSRAYAESVHATAPEEFTRSGEMKAIS